jgi:hypothetical protein
MSVSSRSFDKSVYALPAVKDGMEAFQALATLALTTGDDAWTVAFDAVDPDFGPEELANEFANYVLAQTIERRH